MKLSDDQIAKLAVPAPGKTAKATVGAPSIAAKKPEVLIKAPASHAVVQPVPVKAVQPQDGVGLLLARMEKHE
jgi:hypothetical protein